MTDSIDADSLHKFISLENLFDQLEVPGELRAVLMRPYLSERARTLLARCNVDQTASYDEVKRYLLQEMRLSSKSKVKSEYLL